jgi:hypothetical protein
MIVSERRGFVFVHNPKCAGTTVRTALSPFDTTGNFFWGFDQWRGHKIDKAHLPLFVFKSKYPEYFSLLAKSLVFMFVRNPYQRAISAFNETHQHFFATAARDGNGPVAPTGNGVDYRTALNKFILNLGPRPLALPDFALRHFVRQIDLAYIGHKRLADLVMKLEEWPHCLAALTVFYPDIAEILKAAEVKHALPVQGTWTDYLSDEAIRQINLIYRDDFHIFGYQMRKP